jgi:Co/Zn/Cd efflux system component
MPCDCHGKDNVEIQRHVLVLLLTINATMFCLGVVAGILANSTALLADSLDMLADAAVYGIALYTVGKPNSAKRRAAFTSGIFQGVLGLVLVLSSDFFPRMKNSAGTDSVKSLYYSTDLDASFR